MPDSRRLSSQLRKDRRRPRRADEAKPDAAMSAARPRFAFATLETLFQLQVGFTSFAGKTVSGASTIHHATVGKSCDATHSIPDCEFWVMAQLGKQSANFG